MRNNEVRDNLLDFLKLDFLRSHLCLYFSMMKLKSSLLDLPMRIGKQMYFSREVVLWMIEITVNWLIFFS